MLLFMLAAALSGCDRKEPEPPARVGNTLGASSEYYVTTQGWVPGRADAAAPSVPVAPKPADRMPQGATCVTAECHATLAHARYIHRPIAAGSCDACHDAEAGIHEFPLKRGGSDTCTFCHTVAGTLQHQHAALDQGCTSCHQPHSSSTKYLLKADSVERLCASCHDIPLKRYAHSPFLQNDCTVCHLPHQADNRMLLRGGEGAKHCAGCHQGQQEQMAKATFIHKPADEGCTSCHDPHTTDHPNQLRTGTLETCLSCHQQTKEKLDRMTVAHGAVTDARQCGNCHDPHASSHNHLLRDREDRLCMSCHAKPQQSSRGRLVASMQHTLTQSRFLHGPVQAGNCSACHAAHGGENQALLTAALPRSFYAPFTIEEYALCFGCHAKDLVLAERTNSLTGFRNGEVNLHYLHVNQEKGRTCRACHAVHGSNLPNHIASELPFGESKWVMPIEFEKTDGGGRCSPACHAPATYDRTSGKPPPATGGES